MSDYFETIRRIMVLQKSQEKLFLLGFFIAFNEVGDYSYICKKFKN
jgi:hypothetical protein